MRRIMIAACATCIGLASMPAAGQEEAPKQRPRMEALRINPHPPKMDGRLDDEIWKKAKFITEFTQKEPNFGEPPENRSEVAIVYDEEAVYVGARLHSKDTSEIMSTVSRRDNPGNSERIIVSFDTYHDRRTAYTFSVTVSGTRVDAYHPRDSEGGADHDWNPVWEARTARTADGWSAEMRIPFTQLRFNTKDVQVWGVNLNRWVPNSSEDSFWIAVPKNESGWSSRMGELVGIEGIRPSRRIEVMPYVSSDATVASEVDPDDPFNTNRASGNARVGADFKMGVGPNLTLEATVNPDFGQVEADPAVVNLSAFEVFFPEQRPFFTEGSNLLTGGGANYFYSRRVGAQPHGPAIEGGDYHDMPDNTSIIGAAKLTGRLNSGTSVGVLGAITEKEKADVFDSGTGETGQINVEPLTGWGVVRLQQEFGENASTAGIIITGAERDLSSAGDGLDTILRQRAYSGGLDWNLRSSGGKYILAGNVGMSYIKGSQDVIESTQRSSARFFQRPDVDYVKLDPTRTTMNGWVARTTLEKNTGAWLWELGAGAESPEFELNDIGRLNTADDIDGWGGLRYRQNTPGGIYQSYWLGGWAGTGWNFGRDRQYSFLDLEASMTLKNFYGVWTSAEYFPGAQSDNLTRGGPSMGTADSWNFDLNFWSNSRGKTSWWLFGSYDGDELGGWDYYGSGGITFRPGSRWQLSLSPSYRREVNSRQYVMTDDDTGRPETYDDRYVFAFIERSQLAGTLRLNYAFTPDFTLELYAEPFAASGRYFDHGELAAARSKDLRTYGSDGTTIDRNEDGSYTVTDGSYAFDIDNLDFNVVSFRSNLVMRWEWNPGSTLFFVWQQNRSGFEEQGSVVGVSNIGNALSADGDHFFALKLTYWIPFS